MRNSATPNDYGSADASTIGVPGVNISGQPFTSGQVGITINGGFSNPLVGYSASVPWIRAESNIDVVNTWTKIVGNHTFKWGADIRRVRDDLLQDQTFSPRGAFTFNDVQTSTTGASTNIANDVASFLLDQPSQTGRDLNTFFPCYRQWWIFGYGGDKWQASPKMTLDYGIRWEFYPPATPRIAGGFSNYLPTNNTLVLAGLASNPSNLGVQTKYDYFAPRLGASYRVNDGTVVRLGFGMSYIPFTDNTYAYNYPIRANNSYQPAGGSAFTPAVLSDGVTVATFQAGFPAPVPVTIPSNGIIPASTPALISQVYTYIPAEVPKLVCRGVECGCAAGLRSKSLAAARLRGQPRYSHECVAEHQPAQHLRWRQWLIAGEFHGIYWRRNRSYRCNQRVLPRCLLELRRTPGPTHQTLFGWPQLHFRIHLG